MPFWNLSESKHPLGLNSETENYQTAKSEAPSEMPLETKMDKYDMILHYLKSNAINVNNSSDTDQTTTSSPTLQDNIPSTQTRPIHFISSGNLAKSTMSFKSFKNIQQSHKRSHVNFHTDNMDEIPGTFLEIIENNLTIKPKSKELIDIFNIKTRR